MTVFTLTILITGFLSKNRHYGRYWSTFHDFIIYILVFLPPFFYAKEVYQFLFKEGSTTLPFTTEQQLLAGFKISTLATILPLITNILSSPFYINFIPSNNYSYVFINLILDILLMITISFIVNGLILFTIVFSKTFSECVVYYSIILLLPLISVKIISTLFSTLYGIDFDINNIMENLFYLSPLSLMFRYLTCRNIYYPFDSIWSGITLIESQILPHLCILLVFVFLLVIFAYRHIKAKKYIHSINQIKDGKFSLFFKISLSFGGSFCIVLFLSKVLSYFPNSHCSSFLWFLSVSIFSIIIYIVIDFIITNNHKKLCSNLKYTTVSIALLGLSTLFMMTGGFGKTTRIPSLEHIQSITLSNYSGYFESNDDINYNYRDNHRMTLTNPDTIELIHSLHTESIRNPDNIKNLKPNTLNKGIVYFVEYNLNNGKVDKRYFLSPSIDEEHCNAYCEIAEHDPFKQLHNDPEFNLLANDLRFITDNKDISTITVNLTFEDPLIKSEDISVPKLDVKAKREVIIALQTDMEHTSYQDLSKEEIVATIDITCDNFFLNSEYGNDLSIHEEIHASYSNVLKVLEQQGYGDLITMKNNMIKEYELANSKSSDF